MFQKILFRSNAHHTRTVLSWHWYCPLIGLAPDSGPYDPVTRTLCDEVLGPMTFKAIEMWSEDLGEGGGRKAGNMLTEFGICVPDSEKPDSVNTIECEFVLTGQQTNLYKGPSLRNGVHNTT